MRAIRLEQQGGPEELKLVELPDPVAGQGPLRGILTALDTAITPLVIITTVDMPEILPEHLLWLANTMNAAPAAPFGLLLQRPGPPTRIEPFPSIFHRTAATLIRARLDAGLLSVQSLADTGEFIAIPSPPNWPERVWTNLNRMDDVLQWEKDSR